MNPASVIQAARGPVLLITLGALMVIDYNTAYSFSHTWPVLIITFGILKLLERVAGPPEPPAVYSAPGAPGVGVPPGYQAPPGAYQGSIYEPTPAYQPPPEHPGGNPQ